MARRRAYLIGTDEPLCRPWKTNHEVYRFIWRSSSSFDGHTVVHITREDQAIALSWKRDFTSPAPSVALSLNDWEELQRALTAARFWSLDNAEKRLGLDGANWLIDGRRGDIYHSVHRWNPEGAVHDLGRLFFALAGPPLASVELY